MLGKFTKEIVDALLSFRRGVGMAIALVLWFIGLLAGAFAIFAIPLSMLIGLLSGGFSEVFYAFRDNGTLEFFLIGLYATFHRLGFENYETLRKLEQKKDLPLDELTEMKGFNYHWHKSVNAAWRFLFGFEPY